MKKSNDVAEYYSRVGSWAGYNIILGRSQHAGYWESGIKNEKQAQRNFLYKFAQALDLKQDNIVLDAGSGQGYLAEATGAKITGITITPREVKISEKLSANMDNPPKFILGDYSNTDFKNDYFDVIYVTETLVHAKNIESLMKEFFRILKPNGRLIMADYEVKTRDSRKMHSDIFEFLEKYAAGYGIYQQNPGQILSAMERAGFSHVSELDWSEYTKPTYDRLRRIAKPFSWIKPNSILAPYFVNAVMASHSYSNLYEDGSFRYMLYKGVK